MTLVEELKQAQEARETERIFKAARRRNAKPSNAPSWPFSQVAGYPLGVVGVKSIDWR